AATLTSAVPLLQPRSNSGKMTYYAPGLGACGATNTNADMIVAVPSIVYGTYANPNSSPVCKKTVTITAGSTSVKAAITDRCAGCGASDIDVSPAVFKKFGDESLGKIAVTW
ncbi:expansin-related, partial [Cryphonectria parasitica EP155]